MSEQNKTEQEVLKVYQKVNPSTYPIEKDNDEFNRRINFMENLYLHRLSFPPKMFKDSTLLDFGTGTGEHALFYLRAGASCTFVEMNTLACQRADSLFHQLAPATSEYKIVNESLFDFNSDKSFDIVTSIGVIHHTANKEKAFEIKSRHLKKGGFLVLGVANAAGMFQRNLQRAIIYKFAKSEDDIVSLAEDLFPEHLDAAEKFGRRDRKAIIYDTYVNPKIDSPSVSEVLGWISKNNLTLYSSWPPIVPAILGDPADRKPLSLGDFPSLVSISEMVFLCHSEDDALALVEVERQTKTDVNTFKNVVDLLSDVTPTMELNYDEVVGLIDAFQSVGKDLNPYTSYRNKLFNVLHETKQIIEAMDENNIDRTKMCIKNAKELFTGTVGLGMSWYIAIKC